MLAKTLAIIQGKESMESAQITSDQFESRYEFAMDLNRSGKCAIKIGDNYIIVSAKPKWTRKVR